MKSITKIYNSNEDKSIGEAIVLSALDITVASMFGITADILAAALDITSAMADKVPDTTMKINYIPKKGDDCMCTRNCARIDYVINRKFQIDKEKEEKKRCTKRIQSKRF